MNKHLQHIILMILYAQENGKTELFYKFEQILLEAKRKMQELYDQERICMTEGKDEH